MASLNVGNLGEYLREQRRNAQLSLRQLADAAGVSNPYLSQIERGLRKPSAEVLQQVAKALRISAETLYVRAGILDAERDRDEVETRAVILADPTLNERQKQVLLQIYESFRKENGFGTAPADAANEAGRAADADRAGTASGTAVSDTGEDGGTAARRAREGDGDGTGERRPGTATRTAGGRTSAARRTARTSDGSDADPQQTAG
ncbi:helix-turn-helix domain-containing protein [Streptomyces sp. NPDC000987]|uniref:helix-turn-helix domain-containing protein n=1 Tax=Streptomyces sp. NPDC000987 TaxID=3154374 RepID=UPI0033318DBB